MSGENLCAVYGIEGWLKPIAERLPDGNYAAVFITFDDRFRFDEAKARRLSGKKIVVFDFCEYGSGESWKNTHIFGHQPIHPRPIVSNDEYSKLGEWLLRQSVVLYFKRELSSAIKDKLGEWLLPFPVLPIDLLAPYYEQPPVSKAQWMARPGGLFFLYGHSHDDRVLLHQALVEHVTGEFRNAVSLIEFGAAPLSHVLELIEAKKRYTMKRVIDTQGKCILSVALPGYGVKCFRNCESAANCVPVVADLGMSWAVPWTDSNSVLLPTENGKLKLAESVEIIQRALSDREALYDKLAPAMSAAKLLSYAKFAQRYINPIIQEAL